MATLAERQKEMKERKTGKKPEPEPEPKPKRTRGQPKALLSEKPKQEISIAMAPAPSLPVRVSDTVSIDHIVNECGRDTILSALALSHNPRVQKFVDLWRSAPNRSFDELCLDADIPGDILIGTAAQILVRVGANATKIIMASSHPRVMKQTVKEALKSKNFDERMAFHTMMGLQTQPTKAPLMQQNFNLASQGVPSLAQCPDPINITPLSEETFDAPQEEDVPGTLAAPKSARGAGDTA